MLEQQIREVRRETLREFVAYAERFAREHGEPGTLSLRHLERLVAGKGASGKPVGPPRPATARLLERIFGIDIAELLTAPADGEAELDRSDAELRARLTSSARVDNQVIDLLEGQLSSIRRLDRQLGAPVAHGETTAKADQVTALLQHSLMPARRERLAALLSEVCTLAGWQALDAGNVSAAWHYYERGKFAARESGDPSFESHAAAEQAFVLLDIGEVARATELLLQLRRRKSIPRLLSSWLAAAHGEALAAAGCRSASLRVFDRAAQLLPDTAPSRERPYVVLDAVHLARWRGHALARIGELEAIDVLTSALNKLDSTFTRAETALKVDLAAAFMNRGELEPSQRYAEQARNLAMAIGSTRQRRRLVLLNH
ncbi:hypothetical protein [Amycolatopsis antarctica]|uniref:hypothetical protein n=1 Tax=Amycolatopsis antarctica TaxID=1854586 RepID=UPI001F0B1DCC|nr:hypothetical protein [Amycolatopsis antarctica]